MTAGSGVCPPCPRCGERPPFDINAGVSLTDHYEKKHPSVPFPTMAREIVEACSMTRGVAHR